jgi:hypothetical protein
MSLTVFIRKRAIPTLFKIAFHSFIKLFHNWVFSLFLFDMKSILSVVGFTGIGKKKFIYFYCQNVSPFLLFSIEESNKKLLKQGKYG